MHVVCRCFWCTGVEYTGTGSGRQLSRTDLLLRECGTSQRNALSKLILGIIEVKGDWQLKLSEEDDLISAFDDPCALKWSQRSLNRSGYALVYACRLLLGLTAADCCACHVVCNCSCSALHQGHHGAAAVQRGALRAAHQAPAVESRTQVLALHAC